MPRKRTPEQMGRCALPLWACAARDRQAASVSLCLKRTRYCDGALRAPCAPQARDRQTAAPCGACFWYQTYDIIVHSQAAHQILVTRQKALVTKHPWLAIRRVPLWACARPEHEYIFR
ncbi:hypothetical protein AVEN_27669-1 [Araneus ventricosus]|uniref:Uncharacterized protein n=1 Tax=Araneus ventricosus TaxID=182803 RepID=A0A4Y2TS88_ARAVE|nr:hypothetical protein AVEN_27669-1 [Araneus ventricosus]